MDVLVIRHGIALEREEALAQSMSDRDRPLTDRGRSRTKRVAKRLSSCSPPISAIFTSPLRRATETAKIVAREYGKLEPAETAALLPDAEPPELAAFLAENASSSPVAVVGHEPHLTRFVGFCLTGESRTMMDLGKAGACLIRFDDAPGAGIGRLLWLIPPSILRRL
jgi:phosphohistidine phosphatase